MILSRNKNICIEGIKEGYESAISILGRDWLERQWRLKPTDPLLAHINLKPITPGQQIASIKAGKLPAAPMHYLAQAALAGKEIIAQYNKNEYLCGSLLTYPLISIRDIFQQRHTIPNIDDKLKKLKGKNWKPTIYELLTAAAYSQQGNKVEVIPEGTKPTPDLKLHTKPICYIECKAKLQLEQRISEFIGCYKRNALGKIADFLSKVDSGFVVKIIILKEKADISNLPTKIAEMVIFGKEWLETDEININITPFVSNEFSPPHQMQFHSAEFWEWAVGFKNWNEWHDILPGGQVQLANHSNSAVSG